MLGSTGVLLRFASLVIPAWALFMAWRDYHGGPGRGASLYWMQLGSLALLVPMAWFVTAPDRLPPHVAERVPRNKWLTMLFAPFLPGGGRGILLLLLTLVIRDAIAWQYAMHHSIWQTYELQVLRRMMVLDGSMFLLLALTSALAARWTATRWVRIATFAAILSITGLIVFPPDWFRLSNGLPRWMLWSEQPGPIQFEFSNYPDWRTWQVQKEMIRICLGWGCAAALAVNGPRIVRGIREVMLASGARAREQDTSM